jgi:V/A-type H+/Na+-transporting ATPase subunit I
MAVTKLNKLTLITPKQQQEALLKKLQTMQFVEIENVFVHEENQDWLREFFAEAVPEGPSYQPMIHRLQEAIRFIRQNGDAKKAKGWQRDVVRLSEFETTFAEDNALSALVEIEALQAQWEETLAAINTTTQTEAWATEWQNLDVRLDTTPPDFTRFFAGSIEGTRWDDLAEALRELKEIYIELIYADPIKVNFSCLYLAANEADVERMFQRFGVKKESGLTADQPKTTLQSAKSDLATLTQQRTQLIAEINQQKQQLVLLQQAEELFLTRENRCVMQQRLAAGQTVTVLRGWIPQQDQGLVAEMIHTSFANEIYYAFEEPTAEEIAANKVPTKLQNRSFIQPFEMLTEMYSLPKYDEIDPTPWMTPFYYVFFGMMVADLGYGALMAVATSIGLYVLHVPKGTKRFLKLFQILSVPTMIWGMIYGSFFGVALPLQLLSPSEDFMAIFGLSMLFGGIQLFTGLYLAAKENIRKKVFLGAVNEGVAWLGLLSGLLAAAAGHFLINVSALTTVGLFATGVSALLIIAVPVVKGQTKVGGFFLGLYDLYGVTSYIGDFVSYSRLMALGISGGSIAAAFNLLVGYLPPAARFSVGIILLILLQALNIFLSILSAYVHAARLQYVEFFGKFFTGGGRRFETFKPSEKYVDFDKENGGNSQ